MKASVKKLHQTAKTLNKPLLMSAALSNYYPTIIDSDGEASTINFINDYITHSEYYDNYATFQFGQRVYDSDNDTYTSVFNDWLEECDSIVMVHLDSWARLYYALSLQYNPIWNVDGVEKEVYSSVLTTDNYGQDKSTLSYGQDKSTSVYGEDKSTANTGSRTNSSTSYAVSYDTSVEHQTDRTSQTMGAGTDTTTRDSHTDTNTRDARSDTNTRDARVDTSTVGEHSITKTRGGNIGTVSTSALLTEQWELYKNNFFKNMIEEILREVGVDYED